MAYTIDLKLIAARIVGSSPTRGTTERIIGVLEVADADTFKSGVQHCLLPRPCRSSESGGTLFKC